MRARLWTITQCPTNTEATKKGGDLFYTNRFDWDANS